MPDSRTLVTAVVAQTKGRAQELARELWTFGATMAASFEGLRADLVLIDADAKLPAGFVETIRATVLKVPGGKVRWVSDREPEAEAPDPNPLPPSQGMLPASTVDGDPSCPRCGRFGQPWCGHSKHPMPDPDKDRGLYGKYHVQKIARRWIEVGADGVRHDHVEFEDPGPVFVLAYSKDPHAAVALAAYADSCAADYAPLAADLREVLRGQPECECSEPACVWCEIHGDTGNRAPDHEASHDFKPVAGHPDDDECTYRSDGTDATYCGEPRGSHLS